MGGLRFILPQLDGENYSMRNAVISLLGSVLAKVLVSDKSEQAVQQRELFLDMLEARIHDTSAYVRSRALQVRQRSSL